MLKKILRHEYLGRDLKTDHGHDGVSEAVDEA